MNPSFDPLELFKREIQARCQRSFQELKNKNEITKTLMNNLSEDIDRQQQRIELLGTNIRNIQNTVAHEGALLDPSNQPNSQLHREISSVMREKDRQISQVVQQIISRLQGFEETIGKLPKVQRGTTEKVKTMERVYGDMERQIQTVSSKNVFVQRGPTDYESERDQLERDMNFLEQILEEEKHQFNETNKLLEKNLEVYKATIEQPINNFDVNLSRQNQQNEKILKAKLHSFGSRIKGLHSNLQKIANEIQQRRRALSEGQQKLSEGLLNLGLNTQKLNGEVANIDKLRMEKIHENGNFLDQFVDNMLLQTAELNKRIDNLKASYEAEINKIRSDIHSKTQQVDLIRRG